MDNSMSKTVCWIACFISALTALCVGLIPFGYNVLDSSFFLNNPSLVKPLHYIIGLSGLISLIGTFTCCSKGKSCHVVTNP